MVVLVVMSAPTSSLDVRERLVESLCLDLVGPWGGHAFADEGLPGWIRPSSWYLTGFLIPAGAPPEQSADVDVPDATRRLDVTVRWGDYELTEVEDMDGEPLQVWHRRSRETRSISVFLVNHLGAWTG